MKHFASQFLRDNKGVTAIEYGLIAGVVAIAIAASAGSVGTNLSTLFDNIAGKISSAATAAKT
ncbi:Flp family type IVb pilin [Paraburkholderia caribensis]|uniref:Flp family type IVb pilin n=1 Tax=Paraburkholderia caribensis TaxID=75105 RepID=UPI001CB5F45E|nr:Flp family type IVb pilin [Paraburkholderia caribensis]CAG9255391.1 Flp pilus assembly protein, pilin Flp [Paraburkholderia caribensis]